MSSGVVFDMLQNFIIQLDTEATERTGAGDTSPYNYRHGTSTTDFQMLGFISGFYTKANLFPSPYARRSGCNAIRVIADVPILFGFDISTTRTKSIDSDKELKYTQWGEASSIDEYVQQNITGGITLTHVPSNTLSFFKYRRGSRLIVQRLPSFSDTGLKISRDASAGHPRAYIAFGRV